MSDSVEILRRAALESKQMLTATALNRIAIRMLQVALTISLCVGIATGQQRTAAVHIIPNMSASVASQDAATDGENSEPTWDAYEISYA